MKDEQRHGTILRTQLSITMNFFHTFLDNFQQRKYFKIDQTQLFTIGNFYFFSEFHKMPHLKQPLIKTRKLPINFLTRTY